MLKRNVLIIATVAIFASCNDEPGKVAEPQAGSASATSCYMSVNNRDTVFLKTTTEGNSVTGTLSFNYYEKDKSSGTISGEIKGDLLIAEYKFQSEAVTSIRPVVFKKQGEDYVEGYGEISANAENGVKFRNVDSLDFAHSVPLLPVNCQ